jgi:hypothetical protein
MHRQSSTEQHTTNKSGKLVDDFVNGVSIVPAEPPALL